MPPLDGSSGSRSLYVELVAYGYGDAFNRHVLACAIVAATSETDETARPLTQALGLGAGALEQMMALYFASSRSLLPAFGPGAAAGEDALEEPDLRSLLLDHRSRGVIEEEWLAAIVARRSLRPNHLWQDLGLFNRTDLSRLLHRHFEDLAAAQRPRHEVEEILLSRTVRARRRARLQGAGLRRLLRLHALLRRGRRRAAGQPGAAVRLTPDDCAGCRQSDKPPDDVPDPPRDGCAVTLQINDL